MTNIYWGGEFEAELREDSFFFNFWIHKGYSIVILKDNGAEVHTPQAQHSLVDYIGQAALGIIGQGLTNCFVIGAAGVEVSPAVS